MLPSIVDLGRMLMRCVHCLPLLLLLTVALVPATAFAQSYAQRQVLQATAQGEGFAGMQFGGKVAIDGDLAVVSEVHLGAPTQLRGYRRIGDNWLPAPELSIRRSDESMIAIALSDGNLIYSVAHLSTSSQSVRVKRATATGWVQEFALNSSQSGFGDAVAIAGTRAVIGHPGVSSSAGAVHIVERDSGGGNWTITATLVPVTPQAGAEFGHSVAIVSGAVVVGAVNEDVNSGGLLQSAARGESGAQWLECQRCDAGSRRAG